MICPNPHGPTVALLVPERSQPDSQYPSPEPDQLRSRGGAGPSRSKRRDPDVKTAHRSPADGDWSADLRYKHVLYFVSVRLWCDAFLFIIRYYNVNLLQITRVIKIFFCTLVMIKFWKTEKHRLNSEAKLWQQTCDSNVHVHILFLFKSQRKWKHDYDVTFHKNWRKLHHICKTGLDFKYLLFADIWSVCVKITALHTRTSSSSSSSPSMIQPC